MLSAAGHLLTPSRRVASSSLGAAADFPSRRSRASSPSRQTTKTHMNSDIWEKWGRHIWGKKKCWGFYLLELRIWRRTTRERHLNLSEQLLTDDSCGSPRLQEEDGRIPRRLPEVRGGRWRPSKKTRIKGEIWEKWGATYGRNGCGGRKKAGGLACAAPSTKP